MQDRRGEIGSADATSSISPKVFLFASFLELSNQLLAEVLTHESAPVEDREAAYHAALGRLGEMADSSRRRAEHPPHAPWNHRRLPPKNEINSTPGLWLSQLSELSVKSAN